MLDAFIVLVQPRVGPVVASPVVYIEHGSRFIASNKTEEELTAMINTNGALVR